MTDLLKIAKEHITRGFSIIPVNKEKRSIFSWKAQQTKFLTDEQLKSQFAHSSVWGIATICGAISGNLEVIDLDLDADISGVLYENFCSEIITNLGADFFASLRIVRSRSGGMHWYYYCSEIEGNQKLARRPSTPDELAATPNNPVQVLIETRGEAGYIIVPPTPGYTIVHKCMPPTITPEQRTILLNIARSFNEYIEPGPRQHKPTTVTSRYSKSPFEDYNERGDPEQILVAHGWTYKYSRGGRNFYVRPGKTEGISGDWWAEKGWFAVFTTSTEFEANKAYKPAAVFCLLECNNDWSCCCNRLLEMGFGEKYAHQDQKELTVAYRAWDESGTKEELISALIGEGLDPISAEQYGPKLLTFWDISPKKKRVLLNYAKFRLFLYENGYRLYFSDDKTKTYSVIRVDSQIVDVTTQQEMKAFMIEYLSILPDHFDFFVDPQLLENHILQYSTAMFSNNFREFLTSERPGFLEDLPGISYIPFKNGILEVTPSTILLHPFNAYPGKIWKRQIISREATILPATDLTQSDFFRFLQAISGEADSPYIGPKTEYAMRVFGYMLHGYRDDTRPWAVILAEETETDQKGGGTGKGIFVKALGEIANVVKLDGKNFDRASNFAMQLVNVDTQIVAIDDVTKNFNFEAHYSDITEGLTIEKKHAHALRLPFEISPKFIFSTNYDTGLRGGHATRRFKILEFAAYYGLEWTPMQHFGRRLFKDWDSDEWNRFYNVCAVCMQEYLIHGVPDQNASVSMQHKIVATKFTEEFADWFAEYLQNGVGQWHSVTEYYNKFLGATELNHLDYSKKRFSLAIKDASNYMNLLFEKDMRGEGRHIFFKISKE